MSIQRTIQDWYDKHEGRINKIWDECDSFLDAYAKSSGVTISEHEREVFKAQVDRCKEEMSSEGGNWRPIPNSKFDSICESILALLNNLT